MKHLLLTITILMSFNCLSVEFTKKELKQIHDRAELIQDCYEEIDLQYDQQFGLISELKQECLKEIVKEIRSIK